MQIRVVRFSTRSPLVGAALVALVLAVLVAVVVAVVAVGVTLAVAVAAVGGAALLARRVLLRHPRPAPQPALGRAQEVFPPAPGDAAHRLPPGAG